MALLVITSNDTLTLNGNVFNDFAYGDTCSIGIPNRLINKKTGKNGNTVMAQNASGFNGNANLRVMRGSSDDQFLMGFVPTINGDFPSTTLLSGTFVKRLGDGQGNITSDTYTVSGGVIAKIPDGKENVEGDTDQGTVMYEIEFANAARSIG